MRKIEYTIKDELGIHARPAGVFSKLAKSFESEITVAKGDKRANAAKLLALMGMGIKHGDTITVCADGTDEDIAIEKIQKFLTKNL